MELLIGKQQEIFAPLRQSLSQLHESFTAKCGRVKQLQECLSKNLDHFPGVPLPQSEGCEVRIVEDTTAVDRCREQFYLAAQIWAQLERVEVHRAAMLRSQVQFVVEANDGPDSEPEGGLRSSVEDYDVSSSNGETDLEALTKALAMTPEELNKSGRWELCGFPAGQPLKDFHSGGLLAATCLLAFLSKYGDKASLLVLEFVRKRLKYCSLPQVCCQLTIFVADALRLLPTPDSPEAPLSVAYIARKHTWTLLSEERCFQEVFDIALLTFDDLWRHYTDQLGHTPTSDTLQLCLFSCRTLLEELISKCPRNTEQLWQMWTEQRVDRQQALVEAHIKMPSHEHSRKGRGAAVDKDELEFGSECHALRKVYCGLTSHIIGGSEILTAHHIDELEPALPIVHQCCDWTLVYRMSRDGANLGTLLRLAKKSSRGKPFDSNNPSLLVLRDAKGAVFGGFAPETWRVMGERYYGNGTAAVWSFVTGGLQFFPSSQKNSYYMLTSAESLAMGGGGNFSIFLDAELNIGSSGECETYSSPCLASSEEFTCTACELFVLRAASYFKE